MTNRITDLPDTWCRMWNDDEALAHDLMTDDARQWSGNAPNLDPLVGPGPATAFIRRNRETNGPRFVPRLVVADGDAALAYTWDVTTPDGAVRTGIDVNVLRGGRVAENWTVVAERRAGPDPVDGGAPADRATLVEACRRWTVLWNGRTDAARDVVAPSFGIWFGAGAAAADDLRGPDAFAAYVERHRASMPSLRFTEHREPVVDVDRGRVAVVWSAEVTEGPEPRRVGGIDVLGVHDGRIARVWSITGTRALPS